MDTSSASPQAVAQYDQMMLKLERRFFPDTRSWLCGRATGDTLEVAIGSGLNLPHYPSQVRLTGLDHNRAALEIASARARRSGRQLSAQEGDLAALPFPAGSFDSVVCAFALCEVPDVDQALAEAARVLRPGGRLLLADHVIATSWAVRLGQRLLEAITIRLSGEHFTRRPLDQLGAAGFSVIESNRISHGVIESVHARLG